MTSIKVQIPHISWRDGQPRFQPSRTLRSLGFKGQDLRHDKTRWYTLEETQMWIKTKLPEIKKHLANSTPKEAAPIKRASVYTLANLFDDFFNSVQFRQTNAPNGKTLSERTRTDYRAKARVLEQYDPELFQAPITILKRKLVYKLSERLLADKGHGTARSLIAVLSVAMSWGQRTGKIDLPENPCRNLGMGMPPPRVRAGSREEMRALIDTADAIGLPYVGDMIVFGIWTGQRQSDRLNFVLHSTLSSDTNRITLKQRKTGQIVSIPMSPELKQRIFANQSRRKEAGKESLPYVIIDEKHCKPMSQNYYAKLFARVRESAIKGIMTTDNKGWRIEPTPSLDGFRDQDLRDTAVTWLARAGASIPEIAAITGHSLQSITQTLKHYLVMHPEISDNAINKLIAWHDAQQED